MKLDTVNVNRVIVNILRFGSTVSVFLMLTGLFLFLAREYSIQEYRNMGIRQAAAGALALEPVALMTLGILVLLLTPLFRVVGALFSFLLVEKDRKYALVALGVLIMLSLSLFFPRS